MKKILKRDEFFNFIIFITIFISSLSIILLKQLYDLDELWNYNFARNISKGLIPYKDFNMIVTPLLSFVGGIILKLTTDKLIVIRICSCLLITVISYVIYKIFNLLNIKKEVSIIYLGLIFILLKNLIAFDYNLASLFILLIVLYNELNNFKHSNDIFKPSIKHDILLGIIAGMAVLCKQTVGVLICFTFLMNKVVFIKSKENFKYFLKIFMFRLTGILIPIIICFTYLVVNGAFYDFISYTIKGTKEFSNFYSYTNLLKFSAIGILAVLIPLMFLLETFLLIKKKRERKNYFILVYSLAMSIVIFPISDVIHFVIGTIPAIVLLLYELYIFLYNMLFEKRKVFKIICIYISTFIIIFLYFYAFNNFYNYIKSKKEFSDIYQYQNVIISEKLKKRTLDVDEYILKSKKDVKVLEASAVLYMIPINKYNKDYDMFNKGNFGEDGENRLIEDIKKSENRQYLILKDNYVLNWQTPTKIINYVKENKKKIGEVSIYDIYE